MDVFCSSAEHLPRSSEENAADYFLGRGAVGTETEPEVEDEGLDFGLPTEEVVARIETCALWLTQQVSEGSLPDFLLSSSAGQSNIARSLLGRHPDSSERFARLFTVLNICHETLVSATTAAERELHYRVKPLQVFGSQVHLREAVQDAVLLLRVPRSSLGITCSSKGLVSGALIIHSSSTGEVTDCAHPACLEGRPIPGNVQTIADYSFFSQAKAILVIEKDTVFQQLSSDPAIGGSGRFILVTAKGVPDVATRCFLAAVHSALPHLPLLGLVDWNPSGVGILCLYKYGSRRMAESARYALPDLQWVGVRHGMLLKAADASAFQELTLRDRALLPGLKTQLQSGEEDLSSWIQELEAMEASGSKADIEGVYSVCGGAAGLGPVLQQQIENAEWI
jgi:meiotic recombination protein SPO11